eukprot:scaffold528_cov165-Amphora_coffeaeformis.AAC.11
MQSLVTSANNSRSPNINANNNNNQQQQPTTTTNNNNQQQQPTTTKAREVLVLSPRFHTKQRDYKVSTLTRTLSEPIHRKDASRCVFGQQIEPAIMFHSGPITTRLALTRDSFANVVFIVTTARLFNPTHNPRSLAWHISPAIVPSTPNHVANDIRHPPKRIDYDKNIPKFDVATAVNVRRKGVCIVTRPCRNPFPW